MTFDPSQLIEKSKRGDATAYGILVENYSQYLFSVVFRIINDELTAEDLVQETFIKAWLKIKEYHSNKSKFTTWLYTIATRLCLDKLKSNKNLETLSYDRQLLFEVEKSPDEKLENKEIAEIITLLSNNLSAHQKMIFVLRDLEELDVNEVRQITGFTEKKINDTLYVARVNVRKMLEEYLKSEV